MVLTWPFPAAQGLIFLAKVGTYSFSQEGAMVHVRYTATDGEYRLTFSLKHGPKVCSDAWRM